MEPNIYFNPVSKKRVSEVVYEQIFEKISNKELKQGDRLPSERELAAQFNCGRPSVREALRMLQQDDLIEIDVGANGGAIIKHSIMESAIYPVLRLVGTGDISISDMIAYRKFNDTACLQMAIDNATEQDVKTLQQIMFDYEKHLNKHKETLNQLRESEKSILSNHRDELKEIMRGESVWLSFKAWIWAIIVFELLLVVVGVVVYFCARAKFT